MPAGKAARRGMSAGNHDRARRQVTLAAALAVALRRLAGGPRGFGEVSFSQKPGLRAPGLAGSLPVSDILLVLEGYWTELDQRSAPPCRALCHTLTY